MSLHGRRRGSWPYTAKSAPGAGGVGELGGAGGVTHPFGCVTSHKQFCGDRLPLGGRAPFNLSSCLFFIILHLAPILARKLECLCCGCIGAHV
jgi:hypothetical protein